MSDYSKSTLARGELEFSESERVYGPRRIATYPSGRHNYYDRGGASMVRTRSVEGTSSRVRNQHVENAGTVYIDGHRGSDRSGRYGTSRGTSRQIEYIHPTYDNDYRGRYVDRRSYVTRPHGETDYVERRTYGANPHREHYYVRETIEEETTDTEDKQEQVDTTCFGRVDIVESENCTGMKKLRRHKSENEETKKKVVEEKEETNLKTTHDKNYLMYRRSQNYFTETESDSEWDSEDEHTYAEIDTIKSRKALAQQDHVLRESSRSNFNNSTRVYENYSKSASKPPRPLSANVPTSRVTKTVHSGSMKRRPVSATMSVEKRHVGVQMNTQYVLQQAKPKKKLVRDIGCQTLVIKEKKKKTKKVRPRTPSPKILYPVRRSPSPVPRTPSPPPQRIKYFGEKPTIQHYKTAVIDIQENVREKQHIVVEPTKPPEIIEAPPPPPPKPEPQPIYYIEPEVIMEPLYEPLPPDPLPVKPKPPIGKSMMVRVGGGWMKVEHHRNHHIPLKVYEYNREANKDKFLFVKSRFARKKKMVPIAYKKYREEIIKDGG